MNTMQSEDWNLVLDIRAEDICAVYPPDELVDCWEVEIKPRTLPCGGDVISILRMCRGIYLMMVFDGEISEDYPVTLTSAAQEAVEAAIRFFSQNIYDYT